jgi:murein L,D-transpeptidase YafK
MCRFATRLKAMGLSIFFVGLLCMGLSSCSLVQTTCPPPAVTKLAPAPAPLPKNNNPYTTVDFNVPLSQISNPTIYVLKAKRRVYLLQGKTLVREYPCALGPHPKGDKFFRGDGRTPEGKFEICYKNPCSPYHKSMAISYPTIQDAKNALAHRIISFSQYCSIKRADDAQRLPPSDTALGGQVFIHGGGCHPDWTLGCVAIDNQDIDELFKVARVGTPVYIMP